MRKRLHILYITLILVLVVVAFISNYAGIRFTNASSSSFAAFRHVADFYRNVKLLNERTSAYYTGPDEKGLETYHSTLGDIYQGLVILEELAHTSFLTKLLNPHAEPMSEALLNCHYDRRTGYGQA